MGFTWLYPHPRDLAPCLLRELTRNTQSQALNPTLSIPAEGLPGATDAAEQVQVLQIDAMR